MALPPVASPVRGRSDRPAPDAAEADRLYQAYGPVLYRRCLQLLRDRERALHATRDVFVAALPGWDPEDAPETVLVRCYRAATRYCQRLLAEGGEGDEALTEPALG